MTKHTSVAAAVAIAGLSVLIGCKSDQQHAASTASSSMSSDRDEKHEEGSGAEATEVEITPSALPDAVKSGFAKAYPGATITEAKKETYKNGHVHYELEYKTADGQERDVELDPSGAVLPEH